MIHKATVLWKAERVIVLLVWLQEMGGRHRVRFPCIQIIKTATVPAAMCKRENIKQFHNSKIKFPLVHKLARYAKSACLLPAAGLYTLRASVNCSRHCRPSSQEHRTVFKAVRPTVAMY